MVELIAKRYGSAIFELAEEKDAVTLLQEEILAIKDSFLEEDLKEFLSHPKVAHKEKIQLIETVFSEKISHDLLGLLILVMNKGRQQYIPDILDEVLNLIDTYQGKVKAYIDSPDELPEKRKKMIIDQLHKSTKKEIIPQFRIDESLVGGLVIRVGDRIIDNSIKGHLHSMSKELLETKINMS